MTVDIEVKKAYYDEYWTKRPQLLNSHELLRLAQIFEHLSVIRSMRLRERLDICDLGCGTGWLANQLLTMGNVTGVELSPAGVDVARERYPGIEFIAADLTTWRPERAFDVVVSSEVLEHLTEKAKFIQTIDHILKPGGWVVLTTPNKNVKKPWNLSNQSEQILEEWVRPYELRKLFREYEIFRISTFMFDFSYCGIMRWLSAPKLLTCLERIHLRDFYDLLRRKANLGLYQILLCRKSAA